MSIKLKVHRVGFTLIEMIVFIVVISVALGTFIKVIAAATANSVDPVFKVTALQKAQSQLDAVLARKFDESTPVGGIPACDTLLGVPCSGITSDADFDDVGDFNGFSQTSGAYTTTVSVSNAGSQLGISNNAARLITVNVTLPSGDSITLSAYKVNF